MRHEPDIGDMSTQDEIGPGFIFPDMNPPTKQVHRSTTLNLPLLPGTPADEGIVVTYVASGTVGPKADNLDITFTCDRNPVTEAETQMLLDLLKSLV